MDTLEQIRQRLETFDDLGAIVRTMKALAAVNIRQYEQAVESLAGYYRTVELGLHVVLRDTTPVPRTRTPSDPGPVAAIVFGSDHGLCGRLNEDMADYVHERLAGLSGDGPVRIAAVGARVAALLDGAGHHVATEIAAPGSAERITGTVRELLLMADAWQSQDGIRQVCLFHSRPSAGGRYDQATSRLLPVDLEHFRRLAGGRWPGRSLPAYTMDRERLLSSLLHQYFFVSIFRGCAESLAAENASRLAAMQSAEKSLGERHDELRGVFRRRRQDAITGELLEVVAGYETLRTAGPPG